jgi:fibronectin type 3 domain-containing protein
VSGQEYYYWVRACNSKGCSEYSAYNSGYRRVLPPSIPTNVSASDGTYTDKIVVSWSSVSGATSYETFRATSVGGAKENVALTSATSYNDTSPQPDVTYYYWIIACNTGGCSEFSNYDPGYKRALPPSSPTNVLASNGTFSDKVVVSWNSVSGATSYEIYRDTTTSGTKVKIGVSTATSYEDRSAQPGTNYYYWIVACNSGGCSGFSDYAMGYVFVESTEHKIFIPVIYQ